MTQNNVYFSCNLRPVKFQLMLVVSSILIKFWSFLGWLILTSHWWEGLPKGVKWNLDVLQCCAGMYSSVVLEWVNSEECLSTRCMPHYLHTLSCNCRKVNFYFHYKTTTTNNNPQSLVYLLIILPPLFFLIHSHQTFAFACVGAISPAEMLLPNGHETCLQKAHP